jgi:AraC-like DNA-binding protein
MTHLLSADFFTVDFPLYVAEMRHGMIDSHCHEFFELVYLKSGRGEHCIGGASYPIQAGDVYVISPDEPHAYYPVDGADVCIVNLLFLPRILDETLLGSTVGEGLTQLLYIEPLFREEAQFAHRLNLQGALAYRVEALLRELEQEQALRACGFELVMRNLFCMLLVLLSRAYEQQINGSGAAGEWTRRHVVVEEAMRYIEAHHAEALSLTDVARHTAMSPSRLAHLFKQHTRRSILAYLHEFRINRICDCLLTTDASVSELASNLGYGDLAFFNRVFRRQTGCSPTEYRRRYRTTVGAAPSIEGVDGAV